MRRLKTGFTLIELLVVVSIIALLISLLLPALRKSRRLAQVTQCEAQLSQLGIGVMTYATDNRGGFPQYTLEASLPITGISRDWHNRGIVWGDNDTGGPYSALVTGAPRLLTYYVTQKLAECPLDQGYNPGHGQPWIVDGESFYHAFGNSYLFQSFIYDRTVMRRQGSLPWGGTAILWDTRIEDIVLPSNLVMAGDFTLLYAEYFTELQAYNWYAHTRMHDPAKHVAGMLFVDGHVTDYEMRDDTAGQADVLFNDDYHIVRPDYFQ